MSPAVPEVPAPWSLTGTGYILAFSLPDDVLQQSSFLAPELAGSLHSQVSWALFADYATATCGPYRELLFVPGSCEFGKKRLLTISRIFVSTDVSAQNGRRNWGIPKERCDFEVRTEDDGVEWVRASLDGRVFAELAFRVVGPRIPITTALLPKTLRTLGQRLDGRTFVYSPSASTRIRASHLVSSSFDPAVFPDLARGKILLAFRLEDLEMSFDPAIVTRAP